MHLSSTHLPGLPTGSFLAAGLMCSAMLATIVQLNAKICQFISIKRSTRKDVEFNLVIWNGLLTTEAATLLEAQKKVKEDASKVEQFLRDRRMTSFNFLSTLK